MLWRSHQWEKGPSSLSCAGSGDHNCDCLENPSTPLLSNEVRFVEEAWCYFLLTVLSINMQGRKVAAVVEQVTTLSILSGWRSRHPIRGSALCTNNHKKIENFPNLSIHLKMYIPWVVRSCIYIAYWGVMSCLIQMAHRLPYLTSF